MTAGEAGSEEGEASSRVGAVRGCRARGGARGLQSADALLRRHPPPRASLWLGRASEATGGTGAWSSSRDGPLTKDPRGPPRHHPPSRDG